VAAKVTKLGELVGIDWHGGSIRQEAKEDIAEKAVKTNWGK